jgi:hypothetical protein
VTAKTGSPVLWVTNTSASDTAPNSAFSAGSTTPGDSRLDSPVIALPNAPAVGAKAGVQLSFRNSYNTEPGFDGGVLEISIGGGPFLDIIAAGGSFETGGYNATIGTTDNILTGKAAWTGNSGGFITTKVNLPASSFGQNVQLRWHTAYDTGVSPPGGGMRIDSVSVYTVAYLCCSGACVISCPQNVTVPNDAGECGAIVSYPMPTYTGDCGTVTTSQASGTSFPVGTTTVVVTGTRLDGTVESCSFNVTVNDTELPVVDTVSVDKPSLWPANHKMVDVTVNYKAADNCGVNCTLSVTSNEPINGTGDGDTAPDWEIIDAHHVRLRAERSGGGNGRTYTIAITCVDNSNNRTARSVTVTVPKNQSGH